MGRGDSSPVYRPKVPCPNTVLLTFTLEVNLKWVIYEAVSPRCTTILHHSRQTSDDSTIKKSKSPCWTKCPKGKDVKRGPLLRWKVNGVEKSYGIVAERHPNT